MNGDEQIFVGWVGGTPESFFYFALSLVPCLILFGLVALLFVVALLGFMLNLIALCPLGFSWSPSLSPVLPCSSLFFSAFPCLS